MTVLTREQMAALAAPFPANKVSWKPQVVSGDRALAVAYVDARTVAERLDSVCGGDWSFRWDMMPDGSVRGTIQIGETVRQDVGEGGESEMGNTTKAKVSDAFKRTAVQYGVFRYAYDLPPVWVNYDSQRKRLKEIPPLPEWARPEGDTTKASVVEEKASGGWASWPANGQKAFWAKAREMGMSDEQVHQAFGVTTMKDYQGTMQEAKEALLIANYALTHEHTLEDAASALRVNCIADWTGGYTEAVEQMAPKVG